MSIRWLRNVIIDGEKATLEVQIGDRVIGDKCYTRISDEIETYFRNLNDTRDDIVAQGKDILKNRLEKNKIEYPDGRLYDWQ